VELGLSLQERGDRAVLEVSGELDVATVKALRVALDDALGAGTPRLLVDLTGLFFIDSTGCRELVRAAKRARTAGGAVELVVPPGSGVRRVVDFMQFGELLPVHASLPQ
jgi:anti-anti-sigma factor